MKKEEMLDKRAVKLREREIQLEKDREEFDKILDEQMDKFKKEKNSFDSEMRSRLIKIKNDEARLKAIEDTQERNRNNMVALKIKYNAGIEDNKKIREELKSQSKALKEREINLDGLKADLSDSWSKLKQADDKIKQRSDDCNFKLHKLQEQKEVFNVEKADFDNAVKQLEADRQEVLSQKSQYSKGILVNDGEARRLAEVERELGNRESTIVQEKDILKEEQTALKLKADEAQRKIDYAERKLTEVNEAIKRSFEVKREIETLREDADDRIKIADEKETAIVEREVAIAKREEKLNNDATKFDKWKESLNNLQLDLKDKAKLVDIEERKLRERLAVVQKIRQEIYGNKKEE